MVQKHFKVVAYEHSLYDLLFEQTKGKYFQHKISPHLVCQILSREPIDQELPAWFPLQNKWYSIALKEFDLYVQISEEQFQRYQSGQDDISKIILADKNSSILNKKP